MNYVKDKRREFFLYKASDKQSFWMSRMKALLIAMACSTIKRSLPKRSSPLIPLIISSNTMFYLAEAK